MVVKTMYIRICSLSLILSLFFLLSMKVNANEHVKPLTHFELKPLICIAKEVGDRCQMQVNLSWQSSYPINLCLFQNEQKLKCWDNKQKVSENLSITLNEKSEFKLILPPPSQVLASQNVQINYQVNQKYRRRLRAEWSIF